MTDREKFEAWLTSGASELAKMLLLDKFEGGGYTNNVARIQWESWQAALASQQPADDVWIEWVGGERPVDANVEVKFRTGGLQRVHSSLVYWNHSKILHRSDIIAYRVVKP